MAKLTTLLLTCVLLSACAGMNLGARDAGAERAEPGADPFPRDKTR